jgi:hypothetical protein
VYVPGRESMLYHVYTPTIHPSRTVRARSEYAYLDVVDNNTSAVCERSKECSIPMLVGLEARVMTLRKPPRSESSRNSAKWMKDQFDLVGRRTKGVRQNQQKAPQ